MDKKELDSVTAGQFIGWHIVTNGTHLTARCLFIGPKKVSISRAYSLPLALGMDMPASKALRTGPYRFSIC